MQQVRDWSDKDVEVLLTLKNEGKTHAYIAKLLGRTEAAVRRKDNRMRDLMGVRSYRWNKDEIELLTALAETLPRTQLYARYNELAVKKGYQKRTANGINHKLRDLGQSTKPQSGWYSTGAIAIGLGFSLTKIHGWIKHSGLEYYKEGRNYYVRNDALVTWILEHRDSVDHLSLDGQQWLLALFLEEKEMRGRDGRPEHARSLTK